MRMTGAGSAAGKGLGALIFRRAENGGGLTRQTSTMIVPKAATTAAIATSSPTAPNLKDDVMVLPLPVERLRPWSPGSAPPPILKAGAKATAGTASAASEYGPTEYYGASEGGTAGASAKPPAPLLPLGLILWALFGA